MPPVDPDCDTGDCGDEPPDPDPGCCGSTVCEENETCCNGTTCVLTSSFQTDSNNCGGCGNVCPLGYHCAAGTCVPDAGMGCCSHYVCNGTSYVLQSRYASATDCTAGNPSAPCDNGPTNLLNNYYTWSPEPCPGCCLHYQCQYDSAGPDGQKWHAVLIGAYASSECGGDINPVCIQYEDPTAVGNDYTVFSPNPCPSFRGLVFNREEIIEADKPCAEGECEEHVSTWMAEPSGEANEEGLYKVKWILLDGCPGLCCSDQPTQPEFVKTSTLVDAPCKCGCD
jgi:hypothetical protein